MNTVEYVWVDGTKPTKKLRSKIRVFDFNGTATGLPSIQDPKALWHFDGSSTGQAPADNSDLVLRPVKSYNNPIDKNVIFLCEVLNHDLTPHSTNARAQLEGLAIKTKSLKPWFGLEQEYYICKNGHSIAAEKLHFMTPDEGAYFCGVGSEYVFNRDMIMEHLNICIDAKLKISGANAEVAPGQWEYQIGAADPLTVSDDLWIARWFMERLSERYSVTINYEAKLNNSYNGSGCHMNFSTEPMRDRLMPCEDVCQKMSEQIQKHLDVYGHGYEQRLTGIHETASYKDFTWGISDRTASVRISADETYIEDRRPNANIDPYEATRVMLETCCF